jgi:SGNH hydrolase-like domain, acetyltransferase AlgX
MNMRWNRLRQSYAFVLCSLSIVLWAAISTAQSSPQVVAGKEGWLFLEQELRFLNSGPFWGEHAQTASRARRDDAKDPTPAILAFHQALAEKGVRLLLVPVPPKALIYPEYVPDGTMKSEWGLNLDHYYSLLREKGVQVLDLRDGLFQQKKDQEKGLYCRTDTHWSGYGVTVAANLIQNEIAKLIPAGSEKYTEKWNDIEITGDLRLMSGGDQKEQERLAIRGIMDGSGGTPEADAASPLLVLGDSHVLVFHDGKDMYANGAGISDQLSFSLARPVDVIGVRGSGATPARLSLYRKAQRNSNYWSGKKVVVWCFAAREFTETDGWRVLPIEP